jgi:hypothetical protein
MVAKGYQIRIQRSSSAISIENSTEQRSVQEWWVSQLPMTPAAASV